MTVQVAPVEVRAEEAEESQAAEVSGGALTEEVAPGEAGEPCAGRGDGEPGGGREALPDGGRELRRGELRGAGALCPGEEWKDIDNTLVIQENGMRTAAQEEGDGGAPVCGGERRGEAVGLRGIWGADFCFRPTRGKRGWSFPLVSPEEEETVPATEAETVPETEAATEGATVPETEAATEGAIIPETEAATEAATIPEREAATEGATDPETEGATEAATIPETEAATEGATAPETATEAATVPRQRAWSRECFRRRKRPGRQRSRRL